MNEILPPAPRPKRVQFETLLNAHSSPPQYAPASTMTVETFREHNANNAHLAVNVPAEIASDPNAPPAARLKAAEMISVGAFGKEPQAQVNLNAQNMTIKVEFV
jgi:hypothetical protein